MKPKLSQKGVQGGPDGDWTRGGVRSPFWEPFWRHLGRPGGQMGGQWGSNGDEHRLKNWSRFGSAFWRAPPGRNVGFTVIKYCFRYWPEREINITKPEIAGGKNVHELFLGGVWEHFQPPSSSNNSKNTSKNSSSIGPAAGARAGCCCCFCWCFCSCCCCWGAGSVPIPPRNSSWTFLSPSYFWA